MRIPTRRQWTAAAIDVALVVIFVVIGRASHDSGEPIFVTLWPFLVGLLVGWLAARAWRSPTRVRTALIIWPVTVVVALLLRTISGQGVQLSFIIVTCIVLAVFLLGWRAVATLVLRRRSR